MRLRRLSRHSSNERKNAKIFRSTSVLAESISRPNRRSRPSSLPYCDNEDKENAPINQQLPPLGIQDWLKKQMISVPNAIGKEKCICIGEVFALSQQRRIRCLEETGSKGLQSALRNEYDSEYSDAGRQEFASLCKKYTSECVASDIQDLVRNGHRASQQQHVVVLLDHAWNTTSTILDSCGPSTLRAANVRLCVVEASDREYERMSRNRPQVDCQVELYHGYLQDSQCFGADELDYLYADFCGGPVQLQDLIRWLHLPDGRNRMKSSGRLVVTLCSRSFSIRGFLETVFALPAPFPGAVLSDVIRYKTNMFVFIYHNPELWASTTEMQWDKLDSMYFVERRKHL